MLLHENFAKMVWAMNGDGCWLECMHVSVDGRRWKANQSLSILGCKVFCSVVNVHIKHIHVRFNFVNCKFIECERGSCECSSPNTEYIMSQNISRYVILVWFTQRSLSWILYHQQPHTNFQAYILQLLCHLDNWYWVSTLLDYSSSSSKLY